MKVELKKIKIVSRRDSSWVILHGTYENIKDCLEKNRGTDLRCTDLRGADLRGADLGGANLGGADLGYANLGGANFGDARNYYLSHDFAIEIIHRQDIKIFTEKEWAIIGQVCVHRFCWGDIKKKYGKNIMPVFKKITKAGFGEYENKYREADCEGEV